MSIIETHFALSITNLIAVLLGLLDFPDGLGSARLLSFRRPQSLSALDVVIWRPDAIADLYDPSARPVGQVPLGWLQAQQLVIDTRAWREEFRTFLARGGSLVVIAPAFETLPLHTAQDIVAYDPLEALPEKLRVTREPIEPMAVVCRHGEPFRSLFASILDLLLARSRLSQADSQPIAGSADQVCGLYRFVHPGRLLVLPAVVSEPDHAGARRLIDAIAATVHGLRRSAAQHGSAARHLSPPTAQEIRLVNELESVTAQRQLLEQTELDMRTRLGRLREWAALLMEGDGNHLAVAAAALQSLGGHILSEFDREDSAVIEARDGAFLLMLAHPGERASDCRLRLGPIVRTRCEETRRALQPIVLRPGDTPASWDDPVLESDAGDVAVWHFLRGRDLYEACADGNTWTDLSPLLASSAGKPSGQRRSAA